MYSLFAPTAMSDRIICKKMKRILRPRLVVFVAAIMLVVKCSSLSTQPTRAYNRQHQRTLQSMHLSPPWKASCIYRSRTYIVVSSSSNDDYDDKDQQNEGLVEKLGQYITGMRTSIASFCVGSLFTLLLTAAYFHSSSTFESDSQVLSTQNDAAATKSLMASNYLDQNVPADPIKQKKTAVALYRSILEVLDERYADEIEPFELFETATRGMLSTLDPYTEYISPQDMAKRKQLVGIGAFVMRPGNIPGVLDGKSVSTILSSLPSAVTLPKQLPLSAQLQPEEAKFRVVISLEGGGAYDAGLRVGDEIIEIGGQPAVGTLEEIRGLLSGTQGSKVKISFKRPGVKEVQTILAERKIVQFPNIQAAQVLGSSGDIGYIKLRRFGVDAGISMIKAIESIQSDRLKGVILDLRDNSGGELLSAVQTASLFFPEGTYLGSSEGQGKLYPNESFYAGKSNLKQYGIANSDIYSDNRNSVAPSAEGSVYLDGKQMINPDSQHIVILTNKRTASASEFVAGVFQDSDKAVIIGSDSSTLGKGIGQREIGLPFEGGAIKITYAKFFTPSGRCVQRQFVRGGEDEQKQNEKSFYTESGRKLNNRKGIEVDYRVRPKTSLLNSLLSSSGAYFEFASEFSSKHPIPSIDTEFVVDDSVYNEFKSFVLREQKRGNLKLDEIFDDQHLLTNIETIATKTNQQDSSLIQTSVIRKKVVKDLLGDFDSSNDIIRNELEKNILARQLPDSVLIQHSLPTDDLVQEAVRILEDDTRYTKILNKQSKL